MGSIVFNSCGYQKLTGPTAMILRHRYSWWRFYRKKTDSGRRSDNKFSVMQLIVFLEDFACPRMSRYTQVRKPFTTQMSFWFSWCTFVSYRRMEMNPTLFSPMRPMTVPPMEGCLPYRRLSTVIGFGTKGGLLYQWIRHCTQHSNVVERLVKTFLDTRSIRSSCTEYFSTVHTTTAYHRAIQW